MNFLPSWRRAGVALALAFGLGVAAAAVDVNKADQAGLESIKGIGPALSGKLLAERQKAPFKDWGDLIGRVGGVGQGNAKRLSEAGLTVNGQAFGAVAAGTPAAAKPAPQAAKPPAPR